MNIFISKNITFLLKQRKLNITKLSKYTGINRTKLVRMQNGQNLKFRLHDIIILCNYFGVLIQDFISKEISSQYTPHKKKININNYDYVTQLSENFIYLTNRDNVSLYQLEKELPISHMTLKRLYRNTKGNYEVATILKICEYYEITIDNILKKKLIKSRYRRKTV